jgi:predicted nucleotidyltransferase component of viral defense system
MASLPPLPDPRLLADLARETASQEEVEAWAAEKDLYLTRLIWAIAQVAGPGLLLKGGTLLSKVDLGYRMMSEDDMSRNAVFIEALANVMHAPFMANNR